MTTLAVLQARMSSTRLPGKVMREILGRPMIDLQLERLRRCERIDRVVVATSDDASDDVLASHLERSGVEVFRGPLHDVLARYVGALEAFGPAEQVVRLTADCPLADWRVIDGLIDLQMEGGYDYSSTDLPRRFPHGLDAEVMTAETLRAAGREATAADEREHVTLHIYRRPERFRLGAYRGERDLSHHRWTVDTPADFEFVTRVYERLYPNNPAFTTEDVLGLEFSHSA